MLKRCHAIVVVGITILIGSVNVSQAQGSGWVWDPVSNQWICQYPGTPHWGDWMCESDGQINLTSILWSHSAVGGYQCVAPFGATMTAEGQTVTVQGSMYHTGIDDCDVLHSEAAALAPIIKSSSYEVTGIHTSKGTGLNASFVPASAGTGNVKFDLTWGMPLPCTGTGPSSSGGEYASVWVSKLTLANAGPSHAGILDSNGDFAPAESVAATKGEPSPAELYICFAKDTDTQESLTKVSLSATAYPAVWPVGYPTWSIPAWNGLPSSPAYLISSAGEYTFKATCGNYLETKLNVVEISMSGELIKTKHSDTTEHTISVGSVIGGVTWSLGDLIPVSEPGSSTSFNFIPHNNAPGEYIVKATSKMCPDVSATFTTRVYNLYLTPRTQDACGSCQSHPGQISAGTDPEGQIPSYTGDGGITWLPKEYKVINKDSAEFTHFGAGAVEIVGKVTDFPECTDSANIIFYTFTVENIGQNPLDWEGVSTNIIKVSPTWKSVTAKVSAPSNGCDVASQYEKSKVYVADLAAYDAVFREDSEDKEIHIIHKLFECECAKEITIKLSRGCDSCRNCNQPGSLKLYLDSINAKFSLGKLLDGRLVGDIRIKADIVSPILSTPRGLELNNLVGDKMEIISETNDAIRQIKTDAVLLDIYATNDFGYVMDYYLLKDVGAIDSNGFYSVNTSSRYVSWQVENPDAAANVYNRLRITKNKGGALEPAEYIYQANGIWLLNRGNGLKVEELNETWDAGSNNQYRVRTIKDGYDKVYSKITKHYHKYPWGMDLQEIIDDPDGYALTTTYSYYENEADIGKYSRPSIIVNPDGNWTKYDYDANGLTTIEITSYKDAAVGSSADQARAIYYDYTPLAIERTNDVPRFTARTITEKILGIVKSKTFNLYTTNQDGDKVDILESASSPSALFGDPGNARATTTAHGATNTTVSSDGMISVFITEEGFFDRASEDPSQWVFAVNTNGTYTRKVSRTVSVNAPDGVVGKTLQSVSISDKKGKTYLSENYIKGTAGYERTSWGANYYDDFDNIVKTVDSKGNILESAWGCCGKEWEKDAQGIEKSTSYDMLGRQSLSVKIGNGIAGQTNIATTTSYDPSDKVVSTVTLAGMLRMTSSNGYDTAGRPAYSVDNLGLITSNQYLPSEHKTITIQPSGARQVTETYLDGSTKSVTGNVGVASLSDFGVNSDGTTWSITYSGNEGTSSAIWTKTTSDFFGRAVKEEHPGYGGAIITTVNQYNNKGQLVSTKQTMPETAAILSGSYVPTNGLVMWNKLGSAEEVENSAYGEDGYYIAGSFTNGRFGNCLSLDLFDAGGVLFPKEIINPSEGCIELWVKLLDIPTNLVDGACPYLFSCGDENGSYQMGFNANDGGGNAGICANTKMYYTGSVDWEDMDLVYPFTYDNLLGGAGQGTNWHHYALVWNDSGIPGVDDGAKKLAVYVDGVLRSTSWSTITTNEVFSPIENGLFELFWEQTLAMGEGQFDNIKVWDYAKTNFADKAQEDVGAGTEAVISSTISEYNELGEQFRTGVDVDNDGVLDLECPDRVSESDSYYEKDESGNWWNISRSKTYAKDNSSVAFTNGVSKSRVTGFVNGIVSDNQSIDPLGNVTISKTILDRENKKITQIVDYPDSINDAVSVSINGLTISSIGKTGLEYTFGYDGFGRQVAVTDPRIGTSVTHYNSKGLVDWTEDAASIRTAYVQNELGQTIEVIDALTNSTHTAYDIEGRPVGVWGATQPVFNEYDNYGRKSAIYTLRDTSIVITGYQSFLDNKTAFDKTSWLYDAATGLQTKKVYADGKGPSYTYTPDGKLATRKWARGTVARYMYGTLGELLNIRYSDATPDVGFTYNRIGQQVTIMDGTGTRAFTYNDQLQLAAETNVLGQITRTYDSLGRSSGFAICDLQTVITNYAIAYSFDNLGRFHSLQSLANGSSNSWNYSFLPGSDMINSVSNNQTGIAMSRIYEQNRNLIAGIANTAPTNLISQFTYINDAIGRRTQRIDLSVQSASSTNLFVYNSRSELISAAMGLNLFGYNFDPIGNRISASETTNSVSSEFQYIVNSLNQYTNITKDAVANAPVMDTDGNMISYNDWTFSWDAENRLVGASNGATVLSFTYDYISRRVSKTASGQTRQFQYDGWNMIAEHAGSSTNYYVWGLDLSGSLQGAGGVGGLLADVKNGATYYPCSDANGNITDYLQFQVSNFTFQVSTVAHFEYSPFGQVTFQSGEMADSFAHRYSTKYWDSETGLYQFNYRYYHPEEGRFLGRDPIEESGGVMLYGYCGNDGVNGWDLLGNEIQNWGDIQIDIGELERKPVTRNDPKDFSGNGVFRANTTFDCKCTSKGWPVDNGMQKIICTIKSTPQIRWLHGVMSDPDRNITTEEHENNHFKVYKNWDIPTYMGVISDYTGLYCCNCEERKKELLALLGELLLALDSYEKNIEYPVVGYIPSGDKQIPVRGHIQPIVDYGNTRQAISIVADKIGKKKKTECSIK